MSTCHCALGLSARAIAHSGHVGDACEHLDSTCLPCAASICSTCQWELETDEQDDREVERYREARQ